MLAYRFVYVEEHQQLLFIFLVQDRGWYWCIDVAVNRSPVAATNKDDISVPHYSLSLFPSLLLWQYNQTSLGQGS